MSELERQVKELNEKLEREQKGQACRPFHCFGCVRFEDKPDEPGTKQGEDCHHAIEFQFFGGLAA